MNVLLSLATFGGGRAERARPKSHILLGKYYYVNIVGHNPPLDRN